MNIDQRIEEIKYNILQFKGRTFDSVSSLTNEIRNLSVINIGNDKEFSLFVALKTSNKSLKQRYSCIYRNCNCLMEITTNHCGDKMNRNKLILYEGSL